MTLEELLAQAAETAALNDEELAELIENLATESDALLEGDPTDEALDDVERIATTVEALRTEQTTRAEAAETRAARAAELAGRIHGSDEENEDDGEEGDAEGSDEGDATEGTEGDGEGDSSGDAEGSEDEESDDGEAERIAAAAAPRRQLARTNARRPRASRPRRSEAQVPEFALTASANLPGIQAGTVLDTPDLIGQAFGEAIRASVGYAGPASRVPIARLGAIDASAVYGSERYLDGDKRGNSRKIDAVTSMSALAASGGICAPPETRYDLPILAGTEARPVRDGMTARFGADRGGVRTLPPPVLTDLEGAISDWTELNDQDPGADSGSPETKECLTVTCPEEDETVVDAIVKCLKFGNFRARYFPEQVQAWVQLAAVQHARHAEIKNLTTIGDGSTQVTAQTVLGTTRTVLAVLDRALPQFRQRHRLDPNFPMRFGAPFWLRDNIRTDLARELPGSTDERLAMADAQIEAFFTMRHVNVTWLLEGETGQMYGSQGDGALLAWKSTVVCYLYPEGSWLGLDGGSLDLGIVRDSTLNSTNDFQMFAETFEGVHFHGVESLRLVIDICPDGSTSGTVDIDPCSSGS